MARLIERKFDPAHPTFARKYFTASGRKFKPDDLFDWRKLSISQRRVMQMFEAGKLTHKEDSIHIESFDYYDAEVSDADSLDGIDDMKELRRIADEIGAPYKVSKKEQREAIRAHRKEMGDG
jgi:hypothetical protein